MKGRAATCAADEYGVLEFSGFRRVTGGHACTARVEHGGEESLFELDMIHVYWLDTVAFSKS